MPDWRRMGLALAIAAGMTASCAGEQATEQAQVKERMQAPEGAGLSDLANVAPSRQKAAAPEAEAAAPSEPAAAENRFIIRRGSVTLQVKSVRDALTRVAAIAREHGGFVSDSNLAANEGAPPSASLTLRVPAKRFDETLGALGGVGTVRTRSVSSEDVTLQYTDTESRIRNLKAQEQQLLKLLDRTGKLSEVLEVERELARVRGEIEQSQGRLRHLSALVDLATIQVSLTEQVQVANASPWQLPAVWENAWQNTQRRLASAVSNLLEAGVWLVGYVLPLLVPALILFLLVGWGLKGWLVGRLKALDARTFRLIWTAVGVVLLCLAWPPVIGFVVLAAIAVAVLWGAWALWHRFSGRRGEA